MEKKTRKNNWPKALIVNIIIAAVIMICTDMAYETNDDFAIASRIVDGYPEVFFINYYLALILSKLQVILPAVNAHVLVMVIASFLSFTSILKVILDKSGSIAIDAAAIAVTAVFSFDHYCTLQFTKTAALVTAAALMLIIETYTEKKAPGNYIPGVLLLYYGTGLRIDGYIVAIAFAGIYFLKWLYDSRRDLKEKMGGRRAVLFVVLAALMIGCYGAEMSSKAMNARNDALVNYSRYNFIRGEIVDYSRLDNYDVQKAEYDAAGFSENDIALIKKWYFDYDGAASPENLEKIYEISKEGASDPVSPKKAVKDFIKETKNDLESRDLTAAHIAILAALALWLLLAGGASARLFMILTGLAVMVMHVYLFYIGRPAYRAFYVPDVCAAMWMLCALSDNREAKKRNMICGVIVTLAALLMLVPAYTESAPAHDASAGRVMSDELSEFLRTNSDNFYVTAASEKKSNASYAHPLKAPDTEAEKNYMGAGSWGTMSPYLLDKLGAYGIKNPIKDLLTVPNLYYLGNKNIKKLEEYYNKWYAPEGKTIHMEKTGEADGKGIWKAVIEG